MERIVVPIRLNIDAPVPSWSRLPFAAQQLESKTMNIKRTKIDRTTLTLLLSIALSCIASTALAQQRTDLNRIYKTATDYERLGNYEQAAEHFLTLFRAMPASASYYGGLKRNLQRLGRYDELVIVVRQRLKVVDDIVGHADLGDALYRSNQQDEARKEWDALLERYRSSSGAYSQVAGAMLRNNLIEEAIAVYERGRSELGNKNLFAIEMANAYTARLQYDLAVQEFLHYLDANPKQYLYVQERILSLFNDDSGEIILAEVENAIRKNGSPTYELLQIKANCLKKLNRFEEALLVHAQLEGKRPTDSKPAPNGRELFNFAGEMQRADQLSVAVEAYRELLQNWPNSPFYPAAQIGLAESLMQAGSYAEAVQSLDDIVSENKNSNYVLRAQLIKGDIFLNLLNQPEQALSVFMDVHNTYKNPQAQRQSALSLGDVYFHLGNTDKAREWYLSAYRFLSDREVDFRNTVHYKLAELAFCERQFTDAIEKLEKVEPVQNARLLEDDLVNDALEFIFVIEQNLADSSTALALYAESACMRKRNDFAATADSLEALVARYPQSFLAPKALIDLGAVYGALAQPQKKIDAYQRVASQYGSSIYADEGTFLLARSYEESGQIDKALATYEKILQDFPMSIYLEQTRKHLRALRDDSAM